MDVLYEYVKGHSICCTRVFRTMPVAILLHSTPLHSPPTHGYSEAD